MVHNVYSLSRRQATFGVALGVGAILASKKTFAQERSIPNTDTTLQYLSSELGMRLLNSQFFFAFDLAYLAIIQFETGGLGDDGGLQTVFRRDDNTDSLFNVLFQMAGPDGASLRNEATQRISESGDPLSEDLARHTTLRQNFLSVVEEAGLDPSADLIQSATDSLTHVERISRALIDGLGLCEVFPFSTSRFCEPA